MLTQRRVSFGVGLWTIKAQGVGESLASLVLRARLILRRSSRLSGGVCGPRAQTATAPTATEELAKNVQGFEVGEGTCPWSSFTGPFHESKSPDSPLSGVGAAEASGL